MSFNLYCQSSTFHQKNLMLVLIVITITWGCILSNAFSLPAELQMPQYHHNEEQSPVFQEVSDTWGYKNVELLLIFQIILLYCSDCNATNLDVEADVYWLLTHWLLPYCQSALEGWTTHSTQWRKKPGDSTCARSNHSGDKKEQAGVQYHQSYQLFECGMTNLVMWFTS